MISTKPVPYTEEAIDVSYYANTFFVEILEWAHCIYIHH